MKIINRFLRNLKKKKYFFKQKAYFDFEQLFNYVFEQFQYYVENGEYTYINWEYSETDRETNKKINKLYFWWMHLYPNHKANLEGILHELFCEENYKTWTTKLKDNSGSLWHSKPLKYKEKDYRSYNKMEEWFEDIKRKRFKDLIDLTGWI